VWELGKKGRKELISKNIRELTGMDKNRNTNQRRRRKRIFYQYQEN